MVREMTKTRDQQLWCVLDTRVAPDDAREAEQLEQAISCVATVVCEALERGVKVGLICSGEPFLVLPPGGGRAHRPRLLRELATRCTNTRTDLGPQVERLAWPARWRGPCLVFAAAAGDELRRTTWLLNRVLGATTTYIPGTAAFDGFFAADGAARRGRPGGQPAFANGTAHAVAAARAT
jgi:uncharacterized protein (DUF58 family)